MTIRTRVKLPVEGGAVIELATFDIVGAKDDNCALLFPGWDKDETPSVRVHSECLTGDVFGSMRCDCGPQLKHAFNRFAETGGVILYLRQEGRGIGLKAKIDAYELQEKAHVDTHTANLILGYNSDERDYRDAAEMLKDLGLTKIRLMTNNPDKAGQLRQYGIEVVEQIPAGNFENAHNQAYLDAKRQVGHTLEP